ncbi:hypothetical protein B8A07_02820 [Staphylococcus aureus]|nr:hypothetical protein B8A07_02820 [Staphylococcus aureus]
MLRLNVRHLLPTLFATWYASLTYNYIYIITELFIKITSYTLSLHIFYITLHINKILLIFPTIICMTYSGTTK